MTDSSLSLSRRVLRFFFGSRNERLIRKMRKTVEAINALEPTVSALSNEALTGRTAEFRQRLAEGATLDSLLPEAFAVVRPVDRGHGAA